MGLKSPKFREQPLPASRRSVARGEGTMARHSTHFIFAFLIASCAFAQPVITSTEVVNSASFLSQGLPGSGIAQGSIFTIFGTGVGPNTPVQLGPLPLQTSLGGTSVSVTVGGQTVKAYILFAVSYQVNALLPSSTPTGSGTVTVTYNNRTSQPEPVQIVSASFGTYTFNSNGFGQAIATDLNYQINSIIKTFHPGDWVILWGTGLGAINGDDSNKPPVGNLGSPTVHVGTASLTPYYAGRSADFPGLDQVAFQIPSGIQGCYVPVAVETNGVVSDAPTIAVSTSGQTCSDSLLGQDMINKLAAGGTVDFGFVQLFAIILKNQTLPTGIAAPDFGQATFSEFTPQTAGLASYGVSQGYCIANNDPDMSPGQLDAGAAIILQGHSTATLPQLSPGWGYYYSVFNNGAQFFWSDLKYSVSGAGGAKVGAFSVTDTTSIPSAYFSGITAGQTLPRSSDLTVTWTGGDPTLQNGQVTIAAASSGTANGSISGGFMCTAPVAAKSFTIPKWVLSTLPPTATGYIGIAPYPLGYIWIGQFNNPVTFQAPGLDKGILMDEFFNGYPVYFQ
jgi:uncharacterized protein (TIGR03437 family)